MPCKPQSTNQERQKTVLEVRAAGEVTEGLAAKYGVHRATLWRWAKAEAQINESQGTERKKKVMSTAQRGVWKPSVTAPRLPLLDSLKTHRMNSVGDALEKECCTSVEFIPPRITGLAQVMDVSVMKEFKNLCRNYYVNYRAANDFAQDSPAQRALITEIVVTA
ncbi:hypothetical protein PI124_g8415 [Phytophthora idaei]|nr:hypothetical protein PI124_g8415 [Phytophthora idaei]